jgi:hypothetical protein
VKAAATDAFADINCVEAVAEFCLKMSSAFLQTLQLQGEARNMN